jgi:hypothetical protein
LINVKDAAPLRRTIGPITREPAMRPSDEVRLLRLGAGLLALTLLAAAGLAGDLARQHMAAIGRLCGGGDAPHCAWCYAAVAFALSGLSAAFAAAPPGRARARGGR